MISAKFSSRPINMPFFAPNRYEYLKEAVDTSITPFFYSIYLIVLDTVSLQGRPIFGVIVTGEDR